MAFKGMNVQEGQEVAGEVSEAGQRIMEIVGDMSSVVNSVEWVGSDYDAYREDWNTFIGGPLAELVNTMEQKGKELAMHVDQQTDESSVKA